MIAFRYICGFFLQILTYAFFCLYPFWNRFRVSRKKAVILAVSVLAAMTIPFAVIGQTNFGGDYEEVLCNIIFYLTVIFFLVLYLKAINARTSEKLFVFFVVMSYGFFVTRIVSFLSIALDLLTDKFMYPPMALLFTLVINLIAVKPIMLLMDRIRMMVDSKLEARIWYTLCVIPLLFVILASIVFFPEIMRVDFELIVPLYSIFITVFAFIIYAVIFSIMGYIRRQQEEYHNAERILENYRNQAENNEHIHEIHHEIKHHLNALSSYLSEKDYTGAEQYLKKFTEDAEQLPYVTYTAHPLINYILAEFANRAKANGIKTEYNVIVNYKLYMEDVDLCRILTNLLENATEGCDKVPAEKRYIRLKLHSKDNFLFINCVNPCDESSLKNNNGRYLSTKPADGVHTHGFGLRIIRQIAEKYNGILTVCVKNGVFSATTNLCLVADITEENRS